MANLAACALLLCAFYIRMVSCNILSAPSSQSTTSPLHILQIQSNTNSCPDSSYSACGNGLPDNFCCPSGTTCLSIASNTTAICCPSGEDCGAIRAITCDVQQQNVTASPESGIHTTNLEESLPKCGNNCCPFGYRCNDDLDCELETDSTTAAGSLAITTTTSSASQTTTSPSSPSHTMTPMASSTDAMNMDQPVLSSTAPAAGNTSDSTAVNFQPQSSNRTNIAVGSTIGAAGIVSVIGGLVYFWARRRRIRRSSTTTQKEWRRSWVQERQRRESELAKIRTWRGQSYYARPDVKMDRVPLKPPEAVYYAELPATPLSHSFQDTNPVSPPVRPQSTFQTYMGTKPGKSQDRWSFQ